MKSKTNKNENKISIISLDNITQLQKIAIEGEIAKALSTARHDEEILYRYYVILKQAPKEISYLLVQIIRDMVDIKQELLDRVALEVSLDITPLWIWVNRTVADLKLSLKLACADQIGSASMDRKGLQKKLMKSSFVYFVRSVAMMSPTAAITLCNHILNEEPVELDFLEDACFALLTEVGELDVDEKVNEAVLGTTFDISKILSYKVETSVIEKRNQRDTEETNGDIKTSDKTDRRTKITSTQLNLDSSEPVDISQLLQKTIAEILEAQTKTEDKTSGKFIVVKEYEGCDVSTPLRECNSEEEAEKFIESMKKQFPELVKTVRFKICRS